MASLFNTKISNTYVGLIKTIDNAVINATLKELTDGSGNATGLSINTGGDFKATGTIEWGSLKDTGENITITKFVDEADGIAANDNDTTIPTSAAIVDYVASRITLEDLDFSGTTGTGSVDLDSQVFAITGTANQIETTASSQSLTLAFPSAGIVLPDGSTATTQSAGDNSTKVATTAYVETAVDTVDTLAEILVIGNTTGGTSVSVSSGDNINFTDSSMAIFGTGSDLKIYHDGSTSYIKDVGTGNLELQGSAIILKDTSSNTLGTFYSGGKSELYFNNSKKLETTSDGATVTGGLTATGSSVFTAASFSGTITGDVTGNLTGDSTGNVTATSVLADGVTATTQSSSDNSTKVATTAYVDTQAALSDTLSEVLAIGNTTGATKISVDNTSGGIDFIDNAKARFGTGNDLDIYFDGTSGYIDGTGSSPQIQLRSDGEIHISTLTDSEVMAKFIKNGATELYYNNSKKFETTTGGIVITGTTSSTDTIAVTGTDANIKVDSDTGKFIAGTGNDLQIYHDGSNSYIKDAGTGNLKIQASTEINLQATSGESFIDMFENGAVNLYYDNVKKFETTSTGVTITGYLTVDRINLGDNEKVIWGGGSDLQIYHDSSHNQILANTAAQDIVFKTTVSSSGDTTALTISSNGDLTTGRDVTIAGDLTVNGTTTTVNTEHFNVEDPLISMAKDNAANSVDIGYYGRYNDGTQRYLGLFSDASDSNKFKLFKGLTAEPTTTVDTSGTGYEYADILLASLESRGNLTIKQQDDSGFDGGLIITRSANTQKLVVGMDGGAVNFNSPDSLTYKFRANGTETASIDGSGNATFAGDVGMGKLTATKSGTAGVFNSGTTNVVASFTSTDGTGVIQLADSGGNVEIGAAGNNFVVQPAGGVAQLTVGSSSSTFAGNINGTGLELSNYAQIKVDDAEIYWTNTANNDYWRWKRDASNNFICDHYNGSSTTAALTFDTSQNATFTGTITGTTATFAKDQNADSKIQLYNENAGAAAEATIYVTNSSAASAGLFLGTAGTGTTTAGGFLQDGCHIGSGSNASGGLSIMTRAAADMRFYTNGHTNERMRIDAANGDLTVIASYSGSTKPFRVGYGSYVSFNPTFEIADTGDVDIKGDLILHNSSNAPYIDFVEDAATTDSKARITMDQIDTDNASLIFSTEGGGTLTNRMQIDKDGNVALGAGYNNTNAEKWQFLSKANSGGTCASVGGAGYFALGDGYTTSDAILMVRNDGDRGSKGHASGSPLFKASFNDADAMVIDKDGRTIVGDTSSDAKLKVSATEYPENTELIAHFICGANGNTSYLANKYFLIENSFTGAAYPSPMLVFKNNASSSNDKFYSAIYNDAAGGISFETAAAQSSVAVGTTIGTSQKMLITNTGDVEIGSNPRTGKFQVATNAADYIASLVTLRTTGSDCYGYEVKYQNATPNGTGNHFAFFHDSTGEKCSFPSNGGIRNFQTNDINLSDRRFKEDIVDAPNSLDIISQLKVRNYKLKDRSDERVNTGLIAQEVEEVCKELVNNDGLQAKNSNESNDMKGIYNADLMFMMLKSIQELKAEVDELKNKCNCK